MVSQRQRQILELAERRGYVSVDELAGLFDMTAQTVRRDLNALCDDGLLVRQHGGASLALMNTSYGQRNIERVTEKARIADSVVRHLPKRASLFLSLGTTVETVARALAVSDKQLTVVTNNVEIAGLFWKETSFETVVTGGILQQRNGGLVGPRAVETCLAYRCDFAITSVGGIESDGTALDFHESEIAVMQAMQSSARQHLLVADHTKFGRAATQRFCDLDAVDCLFTDAAVPDAFSAAAQRKGCAIVVAEGASEARASPIQVG